MNNNQQESQMKPISKTSALVLRSITTNCMTVAALADRTGLCRRGAQNQLSHLLKAGLVTSRMIKGSTHRRIYIPTGKPYTVSKHKYRPPKLKVKAVE